MSNTLKPEVRIRNAAESIVQATMRKHLAEADLALARLQSKANAVPATARASESMLRLTKQIKEAAELARAWRSAVSGS